MKSQIESFLKDLSYNSKFQFLDMAKDKDKLLEVAKKADIVLPAKDLAIFECIYAFIDKENKNGCTLEKAEVEKALKTLKGKSIDLDHFRKQVVGHWIDAKLDGDKIIAYGCVFKGSFQEDYDVIKELFDKGNLAVSFEAWGDKEITNDSSYKLTDIEFAGGALLLRSEPAFEGAGVLEMAKKTRVLEFAKVMTAPDKFIISGKTENKEIEEARYYSYEMESIYKALSLVCCPSCDEEHSMDVSMMDFENSKAKTKCVACSAEMSVDLTPMVKLTKKGRKVKSIEEYSKALDVSKLEELLSDTEISDRRLESCLEESFKSIPRLDTAKRLELSDEDFAIVKSLDKNKKIRVLPIHDLAHINYAQATIERPIVQGFLDKLGIAKEAVDRKLTRRVISIAMKSLFDKYKKNTAQEVIQEVAKASIGKELSKDELEKAYNLVTLKAGKGKASDTSLQNVSGTPTANDTSLQNANITEEDVTAIVKEVTVPVASSSEVELKAKLEEATAKIAELTKSLEAANAKVAEFEKAQAEVEKAKVTEKLEARKVELAEYAKDMKDEDILDDTKFELAKLRKENAELKAGKVTPTKPIINVDLTKGSADKTVGELDVRKKIDSFAFGENDEAQE